jgi:hypothetical protein
LSKKLIGRHGGCVMRILRNFIHNMELPWYLVHSSAVERIFGCNPQDREDKRARTNLKMKIITMSKKFKVPKYSPISLAIFFVEGFLLKIVFNVFLMIISAN